MARFNIETDGPRFIRLWQQAGGPGAVALAMGISYDMAKNTASRLRAHGVPLKIFRDPAPDYEKLKKMAKEAR